MRRRWNCCGCGGWGCWGRSGLCLISVGVGVLLALVLPVSVIIFVAGMTLIVLGCSLLR